MINESFPGIQVNVEDSILKLKYGEAEAVLDLNKDPIVSISTTNFIHKATIYESILRASFIDEAVLMDLC